MIYYIRRVIAQGYKVLNVIRHFKGYRVHWYRNSNIDSRNGRGEPCSLKLDKRRMKEERISFPKPEKQRGSNNMLSEIDSGTALPPKTCQLWVLGKPLI